MRFLLISLLLISIPLQQSIAAEVYSWLPEGSHPETIQKRIPPPAGYQRTDEPPGSFGEWLRNLPLMPEQSPVLLFDGTPKRRQDVHQAVIDIDTGSRDLQQCADAVIRLRAEYLFATGHADDIVFAFTNGSRASFRKWSEGYRPNVSGSIVRWNKIAAPDSSHAALRAYLDSVFQYAGSYSLSRELRRAAPETLKPGDVFIHGGFPGHAVIVVDAAVDPSSGKKVFLLAQSYMPAQNIHVLKNPNPGEPGPWYVLKQAGELATPEWVFDWKDLKRFD